MAQKRYKTSLRSYQMPFVTKLIKLIERKFKQLIVSFIGFISHLPTHKDTDTYILSQSSSRLMMCVESPSMVVKTNNLLSKHPTPSQRHMSQLTGSSNSSGSSNTMMLIAARAPTVAMTTGSIPRTPRGQFALLACHHVRRMLTGLQAPCNLPLYAYLIACS